MAKWHRRSAKLALNIENISAKQWRQWRIISIMRRARSSAQRSGVKRKRGENNENK